MTENTRFSRTGLAGFISVIMSSAAFAQIPPDPALWSDANGNPVFNPDGSQVVPVVFYDPTTGIVSIDTRGLNGISDTANGSVIGGDDVGFISIVFESPEPTAFLLTGLQGTSGVGTNWTATYFSGKTQMFGATILDQFLFPVGLTAIATYPTGLNFIQDFGGPFGIEMGINFAPGQPGATIFGCMNNCFPEPSAICLLAVALLGVSGRVREQRSRGTTK